MNNNREAKRDPAPPVPSAAEVASKVGRLAPSVFPGAWAVVVGGSLMRSAGTPTSDADVLVFTEDPHAPYRRSLVFEGLPVEAFVHTAASYRAYADADCASGTPILPTICLEGTVLFDQRGELPALRHEARALIAAGPVALTAEQVGDFRYFLTDRVQDLEGLAAVGGMDGERLCAVDALFLLVAEFQLRARQRWTGAGKWLYRQLEEWDAEGARRLMAAAGQARAGDVVPLVKLVDDALAPHGGRLFDGYWRRGPMPPPHGAGQS